MKFIAVVNNKKVKTFTAKTIDTIYKNFNAFAKEKGFVKQVQADNSFGYLGWSNGYKVMTLQKIDNNWALRGGFSYGC